MRPNLLSLAAALALFVPASNAQPAAPARHAPPPVPGFPIGRCVQVLNVTTPEEARIVGYEYLELALQNLLPLSDEDFAAQVARIRGIGLPVLSGYGFLPADLKVLGAGVDDAQVDAVVRRSLARARQFGLDMVVYGNLMTGTRRVPQGFSREAAHKQFAEFIRRAAIEAKKQGLTILIQPMPPQAPI